MMAGLAAASLNYSSACEVKSACSLYFELGKCRDLLQIAREHGASQQVDKAVFDGRGLCIEAHHLVSLGLDRLDNPKPFMKQALDELGAGRLVPDQHHGRAVHLDPLAHHRALQ